MSRKHRLLGAVLASIVLSSLLVSFLPGSIAQAWSTDPTVNTPVCTLPQYQDRPVMVADGSGGAIIAWQDGRGSSYGWDIYAQRLSSAGIPQWIDNGMAVYAGAGNQWYPAIADDGSGGAIVVWNDSRTGTGAVYAQRVNSAAVLQWTATGIALCTSVNYADSPLAVVDGSGGAVIAWVDWCSTANCYVATVYAQRVNSAGQPQWSANGVAMCTMVSGSEYPRPRVAMTGDGTGGAIVTWQDYGSGDWNVRAQRVNSAGARQWSDDGISVCAAPGKDWHPAIAGDGAAGAIITWSESQGGSVCDVRAQRVNPAGVCQWADNGVVVSAADAYEVSHPIPVTDGSGGAIIAWSSPYYNGVYGFSHIYAQRVNSSGTTLWGGDPASVCTYPCDQARPVAVSDCLGGAIIAWHDDRSHHPPPPGWASPNVYDIYAQRVDSTGTMLWTDNGTAVCRSAQYRSPPALATDGSGAVIIAWNDQRTEGAQNEHIYAQRVTASGELGGPSNQAPATPSNVSPTGTGVSLTPTLQSSAFSDPDSGDTHASSQWQIRTSAGSYSSPVYDSGSTASSLTSVAVPPGMLTYSTTYYWHVRHKDSQGSWSAWSTENPFTTAASPNHPPAQPANVAPSDGASTVNTTPTLSSSAFSDPDAGDTHAASQWQVRTDVGSYSSPAYDSGSTSQLTSMDVPYGTLVADTTYYWHVRHKDNHDAWSTWSAETSFSTPDRPLLVVSNITHTGITFSTATITWTTNQPATSQVQYGLTDQYGTLTPEDSTMVSNHVVYLTNLTAGTTYHYSVKSTVPWGPLGTIGDFSADFVFTTLTPADVIPPSALADLAADSATTNSVTLTWTSPGDDGNTGMASAFDIRYSTAIITEGSWTSASQCSGEPAPQAAGTAQTFTVTGLSPDTTYYFAMKTADEVPNWSDISNVPSRKTEASPPANQPPAGPTGVSPISGATGLGPAPTLTSSAFSDPDAADTHAASQWQVTTALGNYASPVFDSGPDTANLTSIGIPSGVLAHSTPYCWRVRHQDDRGAWSEWSAETCFATTDPPADSTPPTTPAVADGGQYTTVTTGLHASWTSTDPESGIIEYQYAIGAAAGGTDVLGWTSAGTNTEATEAGLSLTPGTTYYFAVKAKNGAGLWSDTGVSDGIMVDVEDDNGNKGEVGGCCSSGTADASASDIAIAWGTLGLCCGTGLFFARRLGRRNKKQNR